jgi:predicted nucleotidyltransferase
MSTLDRGLDRLGQAAQACGVDHEPPPSDPPVQLPQRDLDLVRAILARHGVTAAHRALIFGSRASGGTRRYSDLDIGLAGEPLSRQRLCALREDLEESRLPIRVDVLNLLDATPELRERALSGGIALGGAVGEPS